jgi:hypothetical protein
LHVAVRDDRYRPDYLLVNRAGVAALAAVMSYEHASALVRAQ